MKKSMIRAISLLCAILVSVPGAFGIAPQDTAPKKKKEKHVRIVKVGEDGETIRLDTLITGNDVLIWNGDTIGGEHFAWEFKKNLPHIDSLMEGMDFNFSFNDEDGQARVFRFKQGPDGVDHLIVPHIPIPPHAPAPPHAAIRHLILDGNLINLNDPDIISYEKKKMKDGREKITIVRKAPEEEDN